MQRRRAQRRFALSAALRRAQRRGPWREAEAAFARRRGPTTKECGAERRLLPRRASWSLARCSLRLRVHLGRFGRQWRRRLTPLRCTGSAGPDSRAR
jgi:hypothetical protein